MERITVYVPEEMKDYLEKRKVPMSQFCRSALRNYISIIKGSRKWEKVHPVNHRDYRRNYQNKLYSSDPRRRKQIIGANRKLREKKKIFKVLWELNNFII